MGIALSGVFSGIDSASIISATMAADSQPMVDLQNQVTTETSKETAVSGISTLLSSLQTQVNAMEGADKLNYVNASSSDSTTVSATATSSATQGSHTVVVNQLATAAKEVQAGVVQKETWTLNQQAASADGTYLSADDLAGGTNFSFQFGSEAAVNVDLSQYAATGVTLNQLVSAINSAAGYTAASAVQNNGQYQLQIRSQDVGADRGLVVTNNSSAGALASISQFTKTVSGAAGNDTLVGAGKFVYTYNGVTRTIQTTATTTLANLQDLINNDSSNPGVTASILDYKADDDHEFHLVLAGNSTGASYGITIGSGTTVAAFGPGANWTQAQQAANSQIRVDGYPSGDWIQRSSNTVSDVIPGVTLSLTGLSPDGVQVTVNQDTSQLINNLQSLVSAYNSVAGTIGQDTAYNTSTQAGGVLQGDSTIVNLLNDVRNSLVAPMGGFDSSGTSVSMAAQIGLSIDKTGVLSLDTSMLSTALSQNYQGVLNLIGAQNSGQSDSSTVQFQSATSDTAGGVYEVEAGFDGSGNLISARFRAQGATQWEAGNISGNVISAPDDSQAKGLKIEANWDGSSTTQTANITVQQGIATAMSNYLAQVLDPTTGLMASLKTDPDTEIKNLNAEIADWQTRLAAEQANLQNTYAQLEETLAQLDEQRQAVNALSGTVSSTISNSNNSGTTSSSSSSSSSNAGSATLTSTTG